MPDCQQSINEHYGQSDLSSRILKAIEDTGKDINDLTREDLSSFDQFHNGGLAATMELASLAGLREGMRVLDVGCGDGRTARRIARTAAFVIGVDPNPEKIAQAHAATPEKGGCDPEFLVEDAVTLEFPAAEFDAAVFTRSL